jgi:maltose O-acetyltransferase
MRLQQLARDEVGGLHFRLLLTRLLLAFLPYHVGSRIRAQCLRMAGFRIAPRTLFWGMPTILGSGDIYQKLTIGDGCWFNIGCVLELGAAITIGNDISFGPQVMILTSSHSMDQGTPMRRAVGIFSKPVTIEDGAWLGARSTILPGVTVGAGAVVAAGAVVHKDVPPNTLVAGVPALIIRLLS